MKRNDDAAAPWSPTEESIKATNLFALMRERGAGTFEELHDWSVRSPEAFWERTIKALGVALRKPYWRLGAQGHWEDVHLLRRGEIAGLFPGTRIVSERIGPLTKSWIAVRSA